MDCHGETWLTTGVSLKKVKFGRLSIETEAFWEVLNGVGVDGVRVIFPFFYAFFVFYAFFRFFFAFVFLRFSLLLVKDKGKQQQHLLQKWGISLRPRLNRPRAKLRGGGGGLYGAGAETLILATGAVGEKWSPGRKPKSAVYTRETQEKNRGLGIRCSGDTRTAVLDIHR